MDGHNQAKAVNPETKAEVALAVLSGSLTPGEVADRMDLPTEEIMGWIDYLRESAPLLFREVPGTSAERLRAILESMADIVFVLDSEKVIEAIHAPESARWHMDPDKVFGQPFAHIDFPESARATVMEALQSCQQTGEPQRCVYSVTHRNRLRWFDLRATPLNCSDGRDAGITCVLREITRFKETEQELEASREQFRLAVRGANDGIWDWDLRTNSLYLSPKWKEQVGYEDHELENSLEVFQSLLHPEDEAAVTEYVDRYLKGGGERYQIDFRMRHRDGSYRWIHARGQAILNDEGIPVRMAGSHTDITERKEAELELQRQGRLQELLTEIAATYINLPLEKLEVSIQQSLQKMGQFVGADRCYIFEYDFAADVCINTHEWCEEGIQPEIDNLQNVPLDMVPDWLEVHRKGEAMYIPDVGALPQDSGLRAVLEPQGIQSLLALPLLHKGEPVGFVGFDSVRQHHVYTDYERRLLTVFAELLVNVRMRRMAEHQLREATQRAEAANVAKSEFLANMSHEIRTPMNGIIGMSELLLENELTPQQHRYAANVKSSADSLLVLLNDILDFSKIEAGKLNLEEVPFSLDSLLDEVASIHALQVAHKPGLELVFDRQAELPPRVLGDPARLRQILLNLVGNAVKFTEKGEVLLHVTCKPDPERPECAQFRFAIRDTGIGVPPEKQHELFQKFCQIDNSISRKYGGTGLGLAISNQLAKLMGGSIELTSPLFESLPDDSRGPGAEFALQVSLQGAQAPAGEAVPPHPDLAGSTVLVVDDHPACRASLSGFLRKWGAEVLAFSSGPNALRHLYSEGPADPPVRLALLDESMPDMSGSDLARVLQSDPSLQPVKLIQLLPAASRLQRGRNHQQKAAFATSLVKPVILRDLAAAVARATDSGEPSEPAQTPQPQPPQPEPEPQPQPDPAGTTPRRGSVLLVEDNVINQEVATAWLQQLGMAVVCAASGPEALKALQQDRCDLVFMDIQMPGMNGMEATRRIRRELGMASIPIIAMTAHTMAGDRERCLSCGMNDFLSKPLNRSALQKALQQWLPAAQQDEKATKTNGPSPPPSAPASQSGSGFQLQRMVEFINNEAMVRGLLRSFLKNMPGEVAKLHQALRQQDTAQLQETAHGIKGVAGYFCAETLRRLAATLEKESSTGSWDRLRELAGQLEREFQTIRNSVLQQSPPDWLEDSADQR